jgi:NAD(P)H-hydrate repair Nnr-like enzyme with NAD(P)H-hydrate dehydratase domain
VGGVAVLKGAGSVVAHHENGLRGVCAHGNPGMASAGMGDVLTGMIVSLLAQGVEARLALLAGVYLHGAAADGAAARGCGPIGLTAGELVDVARALLNRGAV